MKTRAILWRRLDLPGCDGAELRESRAGLRLNGTALFSWKGRPCRLEYAVTVDAEGRTRRATVNGHAGGRAVDVGVTADRSRRWRLNGRVVRSVEGCQDLDLNFTPATNTLPLRRLALARGGSSAVRSAWLRFPDFTLHPLDQKYRRTASGSYRYESPGFRANLEVGDSGLILRYGRQWIAVALAALNFKHERDDRQGAGSGMRSSSPVPGLGARGHRRWVLGRNVTRARITVRAVNQPS